MKLNMAMSKIIPLTFCFASLSLMACNGHPDDHSHHGSSSAEFIAHAAVMVESGPTKILFDPIFDKDYGSFQLVAQETQQLMMSGQAPFDGVDAVFVSHAHGDHFAAGLMIDYLIANPEVKLFVPEQALTRLQEDTRWDAALEARTQSDEIALNASLEGAFDLGGERVDVTRLRLPHAGGERQAKIENLVYRVSLSPEATVMHLGDADPDKDALSVQAPLFNKTLSDMAFVPFWFIGEAVDPAYNSLLNTEHVIGVHVPKNVPDSLVNSGADYFSVPGERREIEK